MRTVSVKELRQRFPSIRHQLEKGEEFLLIYQSRPIARMMPMENLTTLSEATDEEVEQTAAADVRSDFLSRKELDYYLSL